MESVDLFVNKLLFVTKDPLVPENTKSPRVIELILELDRGKTLFIGFSACET